MTKDELKTEVDKTFELATKMLNDTGSIVPFLEVSFTLADGKPSKIGVVIGGSDQQQSAFFIKGLGFLMGVFKKLDKIKEVNHIAMMSEGWFITSSQAELKLNHGQFRRPSEAPDRKEMLMVIGLSEEKVMAMKAKEIFRVEVKGKSHFTLQDMPKEMDVSNSKPTEEEGAFQSSLSSFFASYKRALIVPEPPGQFDFKNLSFEDCIKSGIKVLLQNIKGLDAEVQIINKK